MSENINYKSQLKNIKSIVLDVDGVLTDGSIVLMENGDMVRTMNIKDGFAIQHAVKSGILVCVITGARSEAVKARLKYLGVQDVYIGAFNKIEVFEDYLASYSIDKSEVLYMGDDMPDYEIMKIVGLAACPKDAVNEIRELCKYVSSFDGGKGCVRDIVVQVLKAQGKWNFN